MRVGQCWAAMTAEHAYTALLREKARGAAPTEIGPGSAGDMLWRLPSGRSVPLEWELRPNAVWRSGRAFLRCPACGRLATRIYIPAVDAPAACRRCRGLTYQSRQRENYRDVGVFSALGWTSRTLAKRQTEIARERRAQAAAARYAERRALPRSVSDRQG